MNPPPSFEEPKRQSRARWTRRATLVLPLLCLLIFGTVIGARLIIHISHANAATLVQITGHVPALEKSSTLVGPVDGSQPLSLSIGLKLRNLDNLKDYVANASDPDNATKKHLDPSDISAGYAPLASSQQQIIDYLQGYGFQVTKTLSQHLLIDVKGTADQAESAFHIQLNNYKSPQGQSFYAPDSEPSVPDTLANLILSINGLDNVRHFTHPPVKKPAQTDSTVTSNVAGCLGTGNGYGLPSQFASAYNLTSLYNAGYHGEGQTVGLIEFDDYNPSDISHYSSCYVNQNVPINRILIDGGPGAPSDGAIEVELDMEVILSAAPKLADLVVYEAPNTEQGNIDMWSQMINNDIIPVISTSWGACESGSAALAQENSLFTLAAAQGQTILAASGDWGTNDCGNGTLSVDDPASQPYVTGVGGTSLSFNGSETVWNNGYDSVYKHVYASGGGLSSVWSQPSWQQGAPGVTNSGKREVPDVSLNADPNNNAYLVYCSVTGSGCSSSGNWYGVGGTSAAAPMWAAFVALTNERTGFDIGFLNPYLYQISKNASGTSYSNDFHDITSGNNDGMNDGGSTYSATANYDMATGLGSYNAGNLATDLANLAVAQNNTATPPSSKAWYFAEGSVGGQFTEYLTLLNPNTSQTAHVKVEYLFETDNELVKNYSVAPSTRFTTTVNIDLGVDPSAPQKAISAIVTSDVGIVAERPMYFNRPNDLSASGTDVLGATDITHTSFYFAAGDSNQSNSDSSREFITILNPNDTTANITATFYSNGNVVDTETLAVDSLHRGTIQTPYQGMASIKVTSDVGVVVERPIYFKINVGSIGGMTTGAASTIAATTPGNDWLFAEGHTADRFQENLVLANFSNSPTTATIHLEYSNGSVQQVPVTINGQSQLSFDVNNAYLHPLAGCGCTTTADVSVEVTSAAPIVAERVMYFHYMGNISGGTDVVGEAGPASNNFYSFAEGYTNNSFQEWLTLQNPNNNSELVTMTLFFDGTIVEKKVTLPAHSRTTFNINDIVTPVASAYPAPAGTDGYNVSINVQTSGGGSIVVERPLYFNYQGHSQGGTDIIGYTGN